MVPRGEELISLLFDYSAPALGEQDSSGTGLCNVAPVRVGACLPDDRSPGPAVEDGQEHHALPTPRLGTIGEHDRIGTSPAPPPLAAPATRTATQRGGQMSSLWDREQWCRAMTHVQYPTTLRFFCWPAPSAGVQGWCLSSGPVWGRLRVTCRAKTPPRPHGPPSVRARP